MSELSTLRFDYEVHGYYDSAGMAVTRRGQAVVWHYSRTNARVSSQEPDTLVSCDPPCSINNEVNDDCGR